jgi:DNA mismatch repair protein MutS2
MAQSGLMVPADRVELGPFSQVWADIGDEQSLQQSLSTFSGHIKNIAEAIRGIAPGALVLFDEIGAGTDPAEGAALAKAILVALAQAGAAILASTHYGELKAFAYNTEGFTNAAMEFDQRTFRPTYKLRMGAPGASQALRIAERYGIPSAIVERAKEGLGADALDLAKMMERLETAEKRARIAQSEADRRASELLKAEQTAERKLSEADEIRRTAHAKAQAAIEDVLREIRLEAERLFEALKEARGDTRQTEVVRAQLKDLQAVGRDLGREFAPSAPLETAPARLAKGDLVRIVGYTHVGTLLADPEGKREVPVQVGPLKLTVGTHLLSPAEKPRPVVKAILAGVPSVRIVHGKGEGILRKVTQDFLRRHGGIASFRDGEPGEGGHGVTIATLR